MNIKFMFLKINILSLFIFLFLVGGVQKSYAQIVDKKDSIVSTDNNLILKTEADTKTIVSDQKPMKHNSPFVASLMSFAVPGLGQIYNKRIWKIPIIYGAFAGLYYLSVQNDKGYHRFLDDYIALTDNDPNTVDEFNGKVKESTIIFYKDSYRRDRDYNYILIGAIYLLNVIDASVDSHMSNFNVKEDLSVKFSPFLIPTGGNYYAYGIKLSLTF